MDQGYLAHHLLDLVPLEMTDEVERRAVIGVLAQLLRHLLDPVFAQHVDPGGDGLPAGGGVLLAPTSVISLGSRPHSPQAAAIR